METLMPSGVIGSEEEYEQAIAVLNGLLDAGAATDGHPLESQLEAISESIAAYEDLHYPQEPVSQAMSLRFLMNQHGLGLADMPEIGNSDAVASVLDESRSLSSEQIVALSRRFNVSPSAFL
jgi:HTH-type transcriptional regulator/antitoxin HigA